MASKVPPYTRPEDRTPPGDRPYIDTQKNVPLPWANQTPNPRGPRPPAVRHDTEYDPRNRNHIILYTGRDEVNFSQLKMFVIRGGQMVEHTGVPQWMRVTGNLGQALERRRNALLELFGEQVKQVGDEFDGLIARELKRVEREIQDKTRQFDRALQVVEQRKVELKNLNKALEAAHQERRARPSGGLPSVHSDWDRTDPIWKAILTKTRELAEAEAKVRSLGPETGRTTRQYKEEGEDDLRDALDPRTKKPLAVGGLRDTDARIARLVQDKRRRLRRLIQQAARDQKEAVQKAAPDLRAIAGAGNQPIVFTMNGPLATPVFDAGASRMIEDFRQLSLSAGYIQEGRWGLGVKSLEALRDIGVTAHIESRHFTDAISLPNGNLNSRDWYAAELAYLEVQGEELVRKQAEFRSSQEAKAPGSTTQETIIRDLERLYGVVRQYGRSHQIGEMARASSWNNRVARAEIDILRARYLAATGIPQQYADELEKEVREAREEYRDVLKESKEQDDVIRAGRMKLRQALTLRQQGQREKTAAILQLQQIGGSYRALSEEDRRKVDDALWHQKGDKQGRWKPFSDQDRERLGGRLAALVDLIRTGTGKAGNALSDAHEKIQDADERIAGARFSLERATAAKAGEGRLDKSGWATDATRAELGVKGQWETRTGGRGGFRMKSGKFTGFTIDEMPLWHSEWISEGAPFRKQQTWKQIDVTGSASKKLSAEEFARTVGDRIDLPLAVKFTLHSNMEKKEPGGRRHQIGEAVFRHVRKYRRSEEAQARMRYHEQFSGNRDKEQFVGEGSSKEFGERYVARHGFPKNSPPVSGAGKMLFAGVGQRRRRWLEGETRQTYVTVFAREMARARMRGDDELEAREKANVRALEAQERKIRDVGMKEFGERYDRFGVMFRRKLENQELMWDVGQNMPRFVTRTPEEAARQAARESKWGVGDDWKVPEPFSDMYQAKKTFLGQGRGHEPAVTEAAGETEIHGVLPLMAGRIARAKKRFNETEFGGAWDKNNFIHLVQMQYLLTGRTALGDRPPKDSGWTGSSDRPIERGPSLRGTRFAYGTGSFHSFDLARYDPDFVSTDPKSYTLESSWSQRIFEQIYEAIHKTRSQDTMNELTTFIRRAFPGKGLIDEIQERGVEHLEEEEGTRGHIKVAQRVLGGLLEDNEEDEENPFSSIRGIIGHLHREMGKRKADMVRQGQWMPHGTGTDLNLSGMLGVAAKDQRIIDQGVDEYDADEDNEAYEGFWGEVGEAQIATRMGLRADLTDKELGEHYQGFNEFEEHWRQKSEQEPVPPGRKFRVEDVDDSDTDTFQVKDRKSRAVQVVDEEAGEAVMYSYGHRLNLVDPESADYHSTYAGPGRQAAMDTLGEGVPNREAAQRAIDEQQIAEWVNRS